MDKRRTSTKNYRIKKVVFTTKSGKVVKFWAKRPKMKRGPKRKYKWKRVRVGE